jgi:hypothetical protein
MRCDERERGAANAAGAWRPERRDADGRSVAGEQRAAGIAITGDRPSEDLARLDVDHASACMPQCARHATRRRAVAFDTEIAWRQRIGGSVVQAQWLRGERSVQDQQGDVFSREIAQRRVPAGRREDGEHVAVLRDACFRGPRPRHELRRVHRNRVWILHAVPRRQDEVRGDRDPRAEHSGPHAGDAHRGAGARVLAPAHERRGRAARVDTTEAPEHEP